MPDGSPPSPLRENPVALHKCCECVPALDAMNASLNDQRLSLRARYSAALAEIRWLSDCLRLYGSHTAGCAEFEMEGQCSCGLLVSLRELELSDVGPHGIPREPAQPPPTSPGSGADDD